MRFHGGEGGSGFFRKLIFFIVHHIPNIPYTFSKVFKNFVIFELRLTVKELQAIFGFCESFMQFS